MPIESILIGAIVTILFGAICFYLYTRISYTEKKLSMMESILVDVKMAMDSIMVEGLPAPIPMNTMYAPSGGAGMGPGAPVESADAIPEEKFYSSVLEEAHADASEAAPAEAPLGGNDSAEDILESMKRAAEADAAAGDSGKEGTVDVSFSGEARAAGPNIDSMTKQELFSLADQRGLRTRKTMNRTELLTLLRSNDPLQNRGSSTGVENGSGSTGALFPDSGPVDGDYPVDLGQA
jgi:hypothetical protein